MNSTIARRAGSALLAGALCITAGSAQDAAGPVEVPGSSGRDLGAIVRRRNLDASWLDDAMWQEYGYRPQVLLKAQNSGPAYGSGGNGYVYGPTYVPEYLPGDPASKGKFQLAADGTWH